MLIFTLNHILNQKAKLKIQKQKVVNGLSGLSNPAVTIFDLKNNTEYKDKQELKKGNELLNVIKEIIMFNIFKRKKEKPQIKRELPLEFVYQFPTGEKLYTYRQEDWGKISARYKHSIDEMIVHLDNYAMTKNEWQSAIKKLKETCTEAVKLKNPTENIMQIYNTLDYFERKPKEIKSTNQIILEEMFCMFFLLEDETETGYSEIHNAKKRQLLNDNLEAQDFFLSMLKKNMKNYLPISRKDMLRLSVELKNTMEQL